MQRSTVSILSTTTYMWQVGRGNSIKLKEVKPERGEEREEDRERETERERERERERGRN